MEIIKSCEKSELMTWTVGSHHFWGQPVAKRMHAWYKTATQ